MNVILIKSCFGSEIAISITFHPIWALFYMGGLLFMGLSPIVANPLFAIEGSREKR
jgi:hypothetical protein